MAGHGYQTMPMALLSLQSTGAELLARHMSRASPVAETRSYLDRLQLDISPLRIVHVAGTKGKGSVSAFTEAVLRHSIVRGRPLRTGLFTSPHLRDPIERIRVAGHPLPRAQFEARFWHVFDRLYETRDACGDAPPMPGFFRFFTILAFDVFLSCNVDVAIFEVGIGGLLDPTNVIANPLACGVTSIGLDHCDVLGSTLAEIAAQKAGIIKPNCEVVTEPQPTDQVLDVIRRKAALEQVPLHVVNPLPASSLELGIGGDHQLQNAAIAVRLAQVVLDRLEPDVDHSGLMTRPAVRSALRQCKWPGRCQTLRLSANVTLYVDGAHTVESCAASGRWFRDATATAPGVFHAVRTILVFNCAVGRNPLALLEALGLHNSIVRIRRGLRPLFIGIYNHISGFYH